MKLNINDTPPHIINEKILEKIKCFPFIGNWICDNIEKRHLMTGNFCLHITELTENDYINNYPELYDVIEKLFCGDEDSELQNDTVEQLELQLQNTQL